MNRFIVFFLAIIWGAIFYRYVSFPVYVTVLLLLLLVQLYLTINYLKSKIKETTKSFEVEFESDKVNVREMVRALDFKLVYINESETEVKLSSVRNYFTFGETIFLKYDNNRYLISSESSLPISDYDDGRNRINVEKILKYLRRGKI